MKRSVERVDGVRRVSLDLASGRALVVFDKGRPATLEDLWRATGESGFTPERIEMNGEVYKGPEVHKDPAP